MATFK